MARARESMNEGRWCEAATLLEQVIDECRGKNQGHAEALWALAICLFALDHEPGALLALQASLELDPTALAAHELRDALLSRLHERTAEIEAAAKERRLASTVSSRLRTPRR
jgi:tetratricopeptide (TPR) repeat protein